MIQTTQDQFESEIRASHTVTLDELNRYFQAWLHVGYHQSEHSATSQTPHQRFHEQTRFRRHVNMAEAASNSSASGRNARSTTSTATCGSTNASLPWT